MSAIGMKIVNLAEFKGKLKKLDSASRGRTLLEAAEAGSRVIELNAKLNIERVFSKHSSGGLAGSIKVEMSGTDRSAEGKVGPTAIYGKIQEVGGTIKPTKAKMLTWTDPESGELRSAFSVTLPARPYLRPAMDEHADEIEEAVAAQVKRGIEGAI